MVPELQLAAATRFDVAAAAVALWETRGQRETGKNHLARAWPSERITKQTRHPIYYVLKSDEKRKNIGFCFSSFSLLKLSRYFPDKRMPTRKKETELLSLRSDFPNSHALC